MDILNKIIIIRDRKGMSQEEVAKLLGISKSSYCRKERGITQFSLEEFEELMSIFNVTYSDFRDIKFPLVHKESITESLLDDLEQVLSECSDISPDWNINKLQYEKIQDALMPVLKERERACDFPDLNIENILPNTAVKEIIFDARAEKLVSRSFYVQRKLANAIFGARI